VLSLEAFLGGSLFKIAPTPVSVTFGGQLRRESVNQSETQQRGDGALQFIRDRHLSRRVQSGFAELYAPLIDPANHLFGVHRLALTAAARYDDYSDIGSSFNPRFGALWSPAGGVTFRGTFGKSFRPARLDQLIPHFGAAILSVYRDPATNERHVALVISGNPSELSPEKARTWTGGVDLEPKWLPRTKLRATYFRIRYQDRLGSPVFIRNSQNEIATFTGHITADPSPSVVADLANQSSALINDEISFPNLGPLSLSDVDRILDDRLQNIARVNVEGIDLDLDHQIPFGFGTLDLSGQATLFLKYNRQSSASAAPIKVLNTYGNPVDVRFRLGAQLLFANSPLKSLNLFVNHVGDYTDNRSGGAISRIGSWTTVDASAVVGLEKVAPAPFFRNSQIVFSVVNLANQDPPALEPRVFALQAFDSANANPLGRQVQIALTKRW
jgi:outer membrane receptor protein involved in Fe transport